MDNGLLTKSHGFTLLEILVAFVIFSTAVAIILQLFSANLRTLWISDDYVNATVQADAKLREVLNSGSILENVWSETTREGYRMDFKITETLTERTKNLPWRMFQIVLNVSWNRGNRNVSFAVRTLKIVRRELDK